MGIAVALWACSGPSTRTTFPPLGSTPGPAGAATEEAKRAIVDSLGASGMLAQDAIRAYRPPEGPLLAAAPRTVLQVFLPSDPAHGYIVVYAFDSAHEAMAAAEDQAAYVSSNVGRIQFPAGTQFRVRTYGSNVIFFHWTPVSPPDANVGIVVNVLERIGLPVEVPA